MFSSLLLICLLPILVLGTGTSGSVDFHQEEPCNTAGGQCIKPDDCSVYIEDRYLNLCPQQQSQGAECCHGISTKEYGCYKFGGECFNDERECSHPTQIPQVTDCPAGRYCCIIVY